LDTVTVTSLGADDEAAAAAGSPVIDRSVLALVCVAAALVAILLWHRYLANWEQLWTDLIHDRNAHLDFGAQAASDLRNLRVIGLLHDLNSFRSWPPLHDGMLIGIAMLLSGSDPRAAVLPSLVAFAGTAILAFLITRRLVTRWRNLGGALAASLVLVSPTMRAFATDVMIESTGAFFTLLVVYAAVRIRQFPSARAWRFLALALTALFFTKYNYWLIGVAGSIPTVWSRRHALRRSALPRWLRWGGRTVVVSLVAVTAWYGFLGGTAIAAATLAAMATTASVLVWSRTAGSQLLADDPALRILLRWHAAPVLIWLCIPGKFQGFLWYQSPTTNRGESPNSNPIEGIGYYASAASRSYHTSVVIAIVVAVLAAAAAYGFRCRLLRPASGVVMLLIAVAFFATVPHPNRKSRFLEPSMPVVWIAAGAGAAVLVDQLSGRRSWAAAAVLVAVAGAQVPSAFADAHASEGGLQRDRPSALALADSYLPQLGHAQAPAIVSNIPMRFFARWTYQLAFDRSTRPVTEIPGFDPTRSTDANKAALGRWLQSRAVDTLVLVDVTPSSLWFVLAPATQGLSALPDLMDAQTDFIEIAHHEIDGATIEMWAPRP
jgi:hypothetical protein